MGRYELVRPLARGGMAEVYLARRRVAGVEKWLVVKRIRAERATDARFLELFVREARLSMSLVHQNIVPVFDFGRSADQVFLAMERVEGRDLGASVARAGAARLPPLVAAFIAAECCQALDYAHQRRGADGTALAIVHRDVTPRNVLLSWAGEVKLTDFGIASLGSDDGATRNSGTPAYMAPEQATGARVDHRADLYSLGLVLREALTGERARGRGEREATLALARTGELTPWPDGVDVPAALRAVVDRATAIDPDARFADARTMLGELDAVIVAERAARKVEAPARQLAEWLRATWAGDVDDANGEPVGEEVGDMLSFADDDAFGAIGTGTERSMASTAAEGPADVAPSPVGSPPSRSQAPALPGRAAAPEAVRGRSMVLLIAGVGAVGVAAIAARELLERVEEDRLAVAASDDGDREDLQVVVRQAARDDGAPAAALPEPAPAGALAAAALVRAPAAAAPARHVTINSQPWSNFTIDGDPTVHQTIETVALPPGPHVIHFVNPELHLEATAKVDVPSDRDIRFVQPLR
jgi:tRNA A-37 threonylcarbamoyl transferase component Bud32